MFKWLYIYFLGNVDITVEGFFIERFMNICKAENIVLWSSKIRSEERRVGKECRL